MSLWKTFLTVCGVLIKTEVIVQCDAEEFECLHHLFPLSFDGDGGENQINEIFSGV